MTAISDLDIFARVARTGNMSAAGREMGLSPAVVSKRISQLEERLGARLFQRTTRHLTLTETGAGYFKRVVDILSLCEEAEDFVSRRNTKPRGLLKVTMPTAFSRLHIAPYIDSFMARYPEIELDLHLSRQVRRHHPRGLRPRDPHRRAGDSSLVARRIAPDTRVICALRPRISRSTAPGELPSTSKPTTASSPMRSRCGSWKGPRATSRSAHTERPVRLRRVIRELVLAGVGLGLLSTWDIGPALRSGALSVVLPPIAGRRTGAIHAVYPSREFMPAKVDVLIEFLAELYGAVPVLGQGKSTSHKLGARQAARGATPRIGKGAGPSRGAALTAPRSRQIAYPWPRHNSSSLDWRPGIC